MWSGVKLSVLAAAFVVCLTGTARAQEEAIVKVPFPFEARGQMMPAGSYSIERESGNVVMIHGEHGNNAAVMVMAEPTSKHDRDSGPMALTFTHGEHEWRLAKVLDMQ
jgi:hypothetical protein